MSLIPPPGAVIPVSDIVMTQNIPIPTILTDPSDKKELARKIAKTAQVHLKTIQGISTGISSAGITISVP